MKVVSWELSVTEYPLCPALEQNLGSQKFKDDRWGETFVKRLLIKQVTDFHDQGINLEASQTVSKLAVLGTVWKISGVP